jgi:ABC-type polysaccharide/polyol phosphate export permease
LGGIIPSPVAAVRYIDRATERPSWATTVKGLVQYRELLRNLVVKDLTLKYRGSVLGFLWSLLNPLVMMVVYTVAFRYIVRIHAAEFVFRLLVSLLAWTFFATSTAMASASIVDNSALTKSVYFPRAILPIASVLFNLAQYLLTMSVFLPLMLVYYHVPLSWPALLFPVILGLQLVFTCGVALAVAAGTALFRDVRHLVDVGLSILFWGTPIVYPISQVPLRLRPWVQLTPLSPYLVSYQRIFCDRQWPGPDLWIPAILYAVVALTLGARLFFRTEMRFGELV